MLLNNSALIDLKIVISVELGKKKMLLSEFLKTNHGTVLELDTKSNNSLTFYVNNKPFGICEIVRMPNDKLGLRVIEVFKKQKQK